MIITGSSGLSQRLPGYHTVKNYADFQGPVSERLSVLRVGFTINSILDEYLYNPIPRFAPQGWLLTTLKVSKIFYGIPAIS